MTIRTGPGVHQRPTSVVSDATATRAQQPPTAAQLTQALLGGLTGMPTLLGPAKLSGVFLAAFGAALRGQKPEQTASTPSSAPRVTQAQVNDMIDQANALTPEQARAASTLRMPKAPRVTQAQVNDMIDQANALTPEQARAASTLRMPGAQRRPASPNGDARSSACGGDVRFNRLPDGRAMIDALPGSNLNDVRKQAQALATRLREPVCFLGNDGFESVSPG